MAAINPAPGLSVPFGGTFAQEAPNAGHPGPVAATDAVPAGQAPVAKAALDAIARLAAIQGGFAPLFADVAAASVHPDLPRSVQVAARALLARGLASFPLDGEAIRTALAQAADLESPLLALRNALRDAFPKATREPRPSSAVPPPHRNGPPVGEAPQLASIADLDGEAASAKLLGETEAALARTALLRLASLPDSSRPNAQTTDARWLVELPIATAQGQAVIQFRVEREAQDGGKDGSKAGEQRTGSFRISFALDLEPIGPVRASISQSDGRTHVNLVAARETSAHALRDDLATLHEQLTDAALSPGELQCRGRTASREAVAPGLFLDRRS